MAEESGAGQPGKPVLLVVDDEESVCSSLDLVFSDKFEIAIAQTGPEAISKVRDLAPNLMMLDLRLPEMDGLEVLERAKTVDSALEVIVVTAVHELGTAIEAMRRGAFTYVVKPFDVVELRDLADRALVKHRINLDNRRFLETLAQEASRLRTQRNRLRRRLHVAEQALHETQESLLQLSRFVTLGEVAASIAHEIRNPLTVIGSYVQLIRMDTVRPSEDHLERIEKELGRLTRLMHHLMRLAAPPPNLLMLMDMNQLAEEALGLIRPKANVQKIQVLTHLASPAPRMSGDPDQMVQLLLNLFLNACQAMPEGGRLEVTTASVPSPEAGEANWIEILIQDNGVGIPAEILPRIFEPFFTTRRQSEGTGLGLAVVRKIVDSLGGRVTVESEVGVGTVFRLLLPRGFPAPARPSQEGEAGSPHLSN